MKRIVNLTPHAIVVLPEGGNNGRVEFKPSRYRLFVKVEDTPAGELNAVEGTAPVVEQKLKEMVLLKDELPMDEDEVKEFFKFVDGVIVSSIVASRVKELKEFAGKEDLEVYVPNTAKAIRDEQGRIVGVPNLVRVG